MGLDMWLEAREKGVKVQTCKDVNNDCDNCNGCEGGREMAYWRKVNSIHNWFVKNVQEGVDDCGHYIVLKEKLEELREICKKVVANKSLETTMRLLPPTSGFFFGGTDISEYYYDDLRDTIDKLNWVLRAIDFEVEDIYYYASW